MKKPGVFWVLALGLPSVTGCWGDATQPGDAPWGTYYDEFPVWYGSVALEAEYEVQTFINGPDTSVNLSAHFPVRNLERDTLRGTTRGSCYIELRFFDTPDRAGEPVWLVPDSDFCHQNADEFEIPPGEAHPINRNDRAVNLTSWTEPGGTYYVSARLWVWLEDGGHVRTPSLDAGSFTRPL